VMPNRLKALCQLYLAVRHWNAAPNQVQGNAPAAPK
jgi:hypothetical protein